MGFAIAAFIWLFQTEYSLAIRILYSSFCIAAVFGVNYYCVRVLERLSKQPSSIVYMPLENEGTECFRPIVAHRISANSWKVDPAIKVPEGEEWKFQPDDEIKVKNRIIGGIRTPIASELINSNCEPGEGGNGIRRATS